MSLYVDIEKQFSSFKLKVNFDSKNEVLGLLGESGSGKSITLKCISGLITPDKGQIILNDKVFFDSEKKINLSPQLRNTGYLFQNYALFPTMKIKDNIKIGIANMQKEKQNLLMKEYIKKFGLSGLEDRYPWQLSGGQMQRVALARALITSPDILLLDEPFSALDMHLRNNMEKELLSIIKDFNKNVVFVTHDMNEALLLGERICIMDAGKIIQVDTPEAIQKHPKNNFVGQFFKQSSPELANYCGADLTAFLEAADETIEPVPTVFMETNLKEIVQLINAQEKANLVEKQQVLGCITSKTITRFMEQLLESEGQ